MKTTQIISHLLVTGALALGTACSSTNTDATTGTSGNADTSTTNANNTNGTSATNSAGGGASSNSGGATDTGASINTSVGGTAGSTATSGTAGAADQTAFMATFATMEDPVFLMNAASSNMLEIQTGKMAAAQGTHPEVKNFGQMMVSHHTQATQELTRVATPLGVSMPTVMMPVHQAMADQLLNKTGKNFDEAYMDLMETAHKMDIAMFEAKSKSAQNATVKGFATRTLPMLRSHESMADKVEDKVD